MAGTADRSALWKIGESWWLALIALSCGLVTWAAFAYVGFRTRERKWILAAAVYLGLDVEAFVLLDRPGYGVSAAVATISVFVCWVGGFVHGLVIRGEVLDRLSFAEDPRLRDARSHVAWRDAAERLALADPSVAAQAGVGHGPSSLGELVDVNRATAEEFATLPGFALELGKSIVALRDQRGGFDSVDDFATSIDLPIRVVDSVRDRLVCIKARPKSS